MGCGPSSPEINEKKKNSLEIDAELAKQAKKEDSKIKLLLLGAGESGKSTIFKQMKIIYGAKFTEKERKQQLPTIHCNILQGIKILIDQIVSNDLADQIKSQDALIMLSAIDEVFNFVIFTVLLVNRMKQSTSKSAMQSKLFGWILFVKIFGSAKMSFKSLIQ